MSPMNMQCAIMAGVLCAVLAGGACRCADSGDPNPNDEAKQYDLEEKKALEDAGKSALLYTDFTGKLTLFTQTEIDARADPTVIGKFEVDGAPPYLVKPMSDSIKKVLTALNGKSCTLHGKIRNAGKYIYVKSQTLGGPANDFTRRRGGL